MEAVLRLHVLHREGLQLEGGYDYKEVNKGKRKTKREIYTRSSKSTDSIVTVVSRRVLRVLVTESPRLFHHGSCRERYSVITTLPIRRIHTVSSTWRSRSIISGLRSRPTAPGVVSRRVLRVLGVERQL